MSKTDTNIIPPSADPAGASTESESVDEALMPEHWWTWGMRAGPAWPDETTLERLLAFLARQTQSNERPEHPGFGPPALDGLRIPAPELPRPLRRRLAVILGIDHFTCAPHERLLHALGQSFGDLVRRRRLDFGRPPDAVAYPETADQVQAIIEEAVRADVAVIPYGGGTSVVGGVEPERALRRKPVITVDLRRLRRVLEIDRESGLARAEAGIFGPQLEQSLGAAGFTLGHFPQSFEFSTLGGWVATRSWGQESTRYGSIADLLTGVKIATPRGIVTCNIGPGRAAGPEIQELILGSEGAFGIILEATVRIRKRPASDCHEAFLMPTFAAAMDAVRRMMQEGLRPSLCRVSDAAEFRASRALERPEGSGVSSGWLARLARWWLRARGSLTNESALLLVGFAGAQDRIERDAQHARSLACGGGGASLGSGPALRWLGNRFRLPFLRDALLDRGTMVETFETGAPWAGLPSLYARAREAIGRAVGRGLTLCHLSHPNEIGACLYFTVLAPLKEGLEIAQWRRVKRAATESFLRAGGSLSHHHGVGTDHRRWLGKEIGTEGVDLLRDVKRRLDPGDHMNPGKLIPPGSTGPEDPS